MSRMSIPFPFPSQGVAPAPTAYRHTRSELFLEPKGLARRRRIRAAQVVIPALAAIVGTLVLGGFGVATLAGGSALATAILLTAGLLRRSTYPHRLMPFSRYFVATLPPAVGGFVAVMFVLAGADGLALGTLASATGLAVAAALAVELGSTVLTRARPLRIAVLAAPSFAAGLRRELATGSTEPIEVIGWLNVGDCLDNGDEKEQEQTINSIRAAISEHEIDLLVRGPGSDDRQLSRAAYDEVAIGCVDLPVRLIDGSQFYEQLFGHVPLGTIGSDWFLYMKHPSFETTAPLSKRAFDLIGACLVALVALPLIGLAAIGIKLGDGGSIFYRQRRVGEVGREYDILKLRTMAEDAESGGAQWSVAGDSRVTFMGRILRRTHIDELPQIFNVLRGEMSLVGPRPERPEIISELERALPHYKRRLLVKPGVTGWAQVRCGYAGSELGTAWKLCHDLFYLKHRSILADTLIMIETLVIAAKDAHRPIRAPHPEFLIGGGDRVEQVSRLHAAHLEAAARQPEAPASAPVPELQVSPIPVSATVARESDGGH